MYSVRVTPLPWSVAARTILHAFRGASRSIIHDNESPLDSLAAGRVLHEFSVFSVVRLFSRLHKPCVCVLGSAVALPKSQFTGSLYRKPPTHVDEPLSAVVTAESYTNACVLYMLRIVREGAWRTN